MNMPIYMATIGPWTGRPVRLRNHMYETPGEVRRQVTKRYPCAVEGVDFEVLRVRTCIAQPDDMAVVKP